MPLRTDGLHMFSELVSHRARWLGSAVSGAGAPSPTPTSDPACANGIRERNVCCAKSCGKCGGTGCNDFPGGSKSCCSGTITRAANSCSDHAAPCIVSDAAATSPIVSHATVAMGAPTRVLIVRKTGGPAIPVAVCADPTAGLGRS